MFNFYNILEATPWQVGFQDPATPIAARIIEIHHHVFFFLIIVFCFVSYLIYQIVIRFGLTIPEIFFSKKARTWKQINDRFDKNDRFFEPWSLSLNDQKEIQSSLGSDRVYLKRLSNIHFSHHAKLEIIWTSIPSLILILIAIPSFGLLYAMDDVLDPEITLKVVGHQWYWNYEYSDYVSSGNSSINFDSYMIPEDELSFGQLRLLEVDNSIVLPINVHIRVHVTASDVLHSWAVPSLGVKIDAVPYRINSGYIYINRPGIFYGQCSEICGVNHGFMPIVVKGVDMNSFINYLNSKLD